MSDLYSEFTEHLNTPPGGGLVEIENLTPNGEDNIIERRVTDMGYSKKAKTAEANAEEVKKDLVQVGEVKVTRASELDLGKDADEESFKIMFDIIVRNVAVQGMCFQSYTNKKGEKGDMITFPSYKAKNGKYYNYAWFAITNELKDDIINQIDSLI